MSGMRCDHTINPTGRGLGGNLCQIRVDRVAELFGVGAVPAAGDGGRADIGSCFQFSSLLESGCFVKIVAQRLKRVDHRRGLKKFSCKA